MRILEICNKKAPVSATVFSWSKLSCHLLSLLFIAITMSGCDKSQTESLIGPDNTNSTEIHAEQVVFTNTQNGVEQDLLQDAKKTEKTDRETVRFPLSKSRVFQYIPKGDFYSGGTIQIGRGQGSHFHVNDSALTPPPDIPWGQNVTITMVVDYDSTNRELIFTFDPHGSQFNPAARIKLDYRLLGIEKPQLFYIDEEGNRIAQEPDDINLKQRFMTIYVHHFSRYALVHG